MFLLIWNFYNKVRFKILMLEIDRFRLRKDPEVLTQSLPFQCFRPSLNLCICHDAASLPGPRVPLGTVVVVDTITNSPSIICKAIPFLQSLIYADLYHCSTQWDQNHPHSDAWAHQGWGKDRVNYPGTGHHGTLRTMSFCRDRAEPEGSTNLIY